MKCSLFVMLGALLALQHDAYAENAASSDPVWMSVQHDVVDLEAWRVVFDSALEARRLGGELSYEINTFPANPNTIVAVFKWDSGARARAFMDDPLVREAMRGAGVVSEPVVTLYENTLGRGH